MLKIVRFFTEKVISVEKSEWQGGRAVDQPKFCFRIKTNYYTYQGESGRWWRVEDGYQVKGIWSQFLDDALSDTL